MFNTESKILCVIPARGGSKGLKNKNILPLAGKPLIGYTIEAALESKLIGRITVSTDEQKIATIAARYGVTVIRRPKQFAMIRRLLSWRCGMRLIILKQKKVLLLKL